MPDLSPHEVFLDCLCVLHCISSLAWHGLSLSLVPGSVVEDTVEAGGPCFTVSSEVMAPPQRVPDGFWKIARMCKNSFACWDEHGKMDWWWDAHAQHLCHGCVKHYLGLPGHWMVFSPCLGDEDQVKSSSSQRTSSKVVLCTLEHFEHAETFSLTTQSCHCIIRLFAHPHAPSIRHVLDRSFSLQRRRNALGLLWVGDVISFLNSRCHRIFWNRSHFRSRPVHTKNQHTCSTILTHA